MYVMPAQFLNSIWGCYVLDSDNQTLCAYAFYGSNAKPEMRLIAARNIRWDRKLNNFNTGPDPIDIAKLLDVQQEPLRGVVRPAPKNPPQTQPAEINN